MSNDIFGFMKNQLISFKNELISFELRYFLLKDAQEKWQTYDCFETNLILVNLLVQNE